ncbi:MAG: M48 family metallopeptidase [Betaproteobacteria bacterium]|nr:M48 family metallopeptidase [Betaproteobacteria bacterium]
MTSQLFTLVFLLFLLLSFGVGVWLSLRHIRHIAANRHAVPAEFTESITLEAHQKAADYTIARNRLGLIESGVDALLLLGLTLGGGLLLISQVAGDFASHRYLPGLLIFALLGIVSSIVSTPFDLCRTFVIESRFGFNKMTWQLYLLDMVKGLVLSAAIGIPLLLVVFWLMEKMGSLWWLYVWLVWLGFSLTMLAIYPNFIAPMFNKFSPLSDASLKERIEALLKRCGFTSSGLFVMDGSKRSSHGNAYFTGFGKTKRIVFFDTLIERLTPTEIEAVLAHELGHFKRKHIVKRIVSQFAITFVVLALMGWVIDKPWFYKGLGIPFDGAAPHVAVSLVLFFLVLPVFTFWMTPLGSLISRKHEFEADAYAASQTEVNDLITALVKLYRDNASTLTPDPLHSAVYDSHPPASIRIAHLKSLQTA